MLFFTPMTRARPPGLPPDIQIIRQPFTAEGLRAPAHALLDGQAPEGHLSRSAE
ncbi:MAG TPA: hypothetical protein VJ794_09950 [Gemmatimonadales bacterium]|nr:hypothetical protein [Gemmatimonadales bacterium]